MRQSRRNPPSKRTFEDFTEVGLSNGEVDDTEDIADSMGVFRGLVEMGIVRGDVTADRWRLRKPVLGAPGPPPRERFEKATRKVGSVQRIPLRATGEIPQQRLHSRLVLYPNA